MPSDVANSIAGPVPPVRETATEGSGVDAVATAVREFRAGSAIIVCDRDSCVWAAPAESIEAGVVNRFAHSGGVISVAMSPERVDALGLPAMVGTPSCAPIEHLASVDTDNGGTGISVLDRTATIRALCGDAPTKSLVTPGHVFPLRVEPEENGTEMGIPQACLALAGDAGIAPVVAFCQILDDAGELLRPDQIGSTLGVQGAIVVSTRSVLAHRRGLGAVSNCDIADFRESMSQLVSGVAAVTVRDRDGRPRGMLATSITSYTDKPPTLLVCVHQDSRTHDPLMDALGFGVHLLSSDQTDVATELAGKGENKFANLAWSWDGDVPRIADTAVYLRCATSATFEHHDHTILIGEIERAESRDATPLVYFKRSYAWTLGA